MLGLNKKVEFVIVCTIYIVYETIQSEKDRNGSKMLIKFSCIPSSFFSDAYPEMVFIG